MPDDGYQFGRNRTPPLRDRGADDGPGFGNMGQEDDGDALTLAPMLQPGVPFEITIDDDGGVTLPMPAVHTREPAQRNKHRENLANNPDLDLEGIAHELLEGIEADQNSRKEWLDNYAQGLNLLGLKIETDSTDGSASKIGHPLLLQAVVEGQSAVASELMPSRGPCKISERDDPGDTEQGDKARGLADDMNHYLTKTERSYYPDFDRGLFGLEFGGNLFKRVYKHPLRRRPCGECVSVDDLIVSEDATDLDTAIRVTQRSELSGNTIRRMQWRGGWRDVDLSIPMVNLDAAQRKRDEIQGTSPYGIRPRDLTHTIYQSTTDLCLEDYGGSERHAPSDVPISYMVTLEKDSAKVLDIRRQWAFGDEMFERQTEYVHYGMVPALGFLCLGFVHLLGNQTRALRAGWRILVDAGLYGNIQAWIKAKGVRGTTQIRPMPGEVVELDLGPYDDIAKALMPLPTKDPSSVFIQLCEMIGKESQALGGVLKAGTGEGRADIPVATMLAMIEQTTQVASAVQKRYYRAQARELTMFKELFAEDPESLIALNPNPAQRNRTRAEVMDQELIPQADPNVPSQIHRIMLATAMVTMAGQNPDIYDRVEVHKRAWASIGVNDAESVLHQPTPPAPDPGKAGAPPDPLIGQARMIEAQAKIAKTKQDAVTDQRKAANEMLDAQQQQQKIAAEGQQHTAELASEERIQNARLAVERERMQVEEMRARREHEHAVLEANQEHQRGQMEHQLGFAQLANEQQMHQGEQQMRGAELAQAGQQHEADLQHQGRQMAQQGRQHKDEIGVKKIAARRPPAGGGGKRR